MALREGGSYEVDYRVVRPDDLRQRRLDRCRSDLEAARRTESITSIALRWGFNDPSHFSRLFRRRYGVAPRALARKRQEA